MKKDSKKNKLFLLLILVLMISVGYAAIASTLKINGNTTVKGLNWSVYWDNVQVTTGSVTGANVTTTPTTTGTRTTEVDFAVILPEPGDFYEFEVDAVNAGTIDAMIADDGIIKKAYSDSSYTTEVQLPKVLKYTVTYADGTEIEDNHLLAKKSGNTPTRETYKVRVEYRNDDEIDPEDLDSVNDRQYYLRFQVEYVQADGNATPSHSAIHYVNRQVEGQITPGDVIGIGETEDFYVISSDAQKTVLLAKYNLLVGNESHDMGITITPMNSATIQGYGLQSANAISYNWDTSEWKGMVAFSSTNYWMSGNDLLSPYNENNTIIWDDSNYMFKYISNNEQAYPKVYNSSLTTPPDFSSECQYDENYNPINNCWGTPGYSIAYYVEQYKTRLIEMGAPSTITGRLLRYEEADATQGIEYNGTSIIYDGSHSYWLGSPYSEVVVWSVLYGRYFGSIGYGYGDSCGVRPVIEIATSDIPTE